MNPADELDKIAVDWKLATDFWVKKKAVFNAYPDDTGRLINLTDQVFVAGNWFAPVAIDPNHTAVFQFRFAPATYFFRSLYKAGGMS